jgi:hypothetical protein
MLPAHCSSVFDVWLSVLDSSLASVVQYCQTFRDFTAIDYRIAPSMSMRGKVRVGRTMPCRTRARLPIGA